MLQVLIAYFVPFFGACVYHRLQLTPTGALMSLIGALCVTMMVFVLPVGALLLGTLDSLLASAHSTFV